MECHSKIRSRLNLNIFKTKLDKCMGELEGIAGRYVVWCGMYRALFQKKNCKGGGVLYRYIGIWS